MAPLLLHEADRRALPGQRAFDEHHLAFGQARDAAPFGVEALDLENYRFSG